MKTLAPSQLGWYKCQVCTRDNVYLLGQSILLQSWYFIASPVHASPPFSASCILDLFLCWVPVVPQVREQLDQFSSQLSQMQCSIKSMFHVSVSKWFLLRVLVMILLQTCHKYRVHTFSIITICCITSLDFFGISCTFLTTMICYYGFRSGFWLTPTAAIFWTSCPFRCPITPYTIN